MTQSKRNHGQQQGGQQGQQWSGQFAIIVPIEAIGLLLKQQGGGYPMPAQRQFKASMAGGFEQSGQQRQRSQGSSKSGRSKRNKQLISVTITGDAKLIRSVTDSARARGGNIS